MDGLPSGLFQVGCYDPFHIFVPNILVASLIRTFFFWGVFEIWKLLQ
jgi:hypothetical protein